MGSKRRLSQNVSASVNKLRLDSLSKILKIDSGKSQKNKRETIAKQASRVVLSELLKNAPGSIGANTSAQVIPDFKTFLSTKDNIQLFREFLKTQYCHENIDFYLACEKYRHLDPEKVGKEFIKLMATQIFNDFLSKTARHPVNIDYDCLCTIIERMIDPRPNLLDDAQTEIFTLMRADCYPRFCKTWQLDKETANKILCERPHIESTPLSNKTINTTMTTTCSDLSSYLNMTQRSVQSRCLRQKDVVPATNQQGCPIECPYYRLGLPCQRHSSDDEDHLKHGRISDLVDKINLSRIHQVPSYCVRRRNSPPQKRPPRRTPPPPPILPPALPPKPDYF